MPTIEEIEAELNELLKENRRRIDGEKTNYKLDAVLILTTGCIKVNKFMLLGLHCQNEK